jgi:hypothetical protein
MVWGRILTELAGLQDAAPAGSPGAVVNPIVGGPYIVDTCCAAAVFASEYQRSGDERWQKRANDAVTAIRSAGLFRGIHEPAWDVFGWHDVPDSLTATGIAMDAYCEALDRLGLARNADRVGDLTDFVLKCRTKKGGFAHNALTPGQHAAEVLNATASALKMLGRLSRGEATKGRYGGGELDTILRRIGRGQSASGFWPYFSPRSTLRKVLDIPFKDVLMPHRYPRYLRAGDWGDITHHAMTLYFAAGYVSSFPTTAGAQVVASGWAWIRKRLVSEKGHSAAIDWTIDPVPGAPQYSNARDTNAYFLILGTLPHLTLLGILDEAECNALAQALLAHIGSALMTEPGQAPCVAPCEGPREVVRNVLPMFEQSVAWKGRLAAEVILALEKDSRSEPPVVVRGEPG